MRTVAAEKPRCLSPRAVGHNQHELRNVIRRLAKCRNTSPALDANVGRSPTCATRDATRRQPAVQLRCEITGVSLNSTSQCSQSSITGDRLLDIDDIVALFRRSRETVNRWCRKGKIPAFKLEKNWFAWHSDIVRDSKTSGKVCRSSAPLRGDQTVSELKRRSIYQYGTLVPESRKRGPNVLGLPLSAVGQRKAQTSQSDPWHKWNSYRRDWMPSAPVNICDWQRTRRNQPKLVPRCEGWWIATSARFFSPVWKCRSAASKTKPAQCHSRTQSHTDQRSTSTFFHVGRSIASSGLKKQRCVPESKSGYARSSARAAIPMD